MSSRHFDINLGGDISEPECDETVSESVTISNGNTKPLFDPTYESDDYDLDFDEEEEFDMNPDHYDRPWWEMRDDEWLSDGETPTEIEIASGEGDEYGDRVRDLVEAWRQGNAQPYVPQVEYIDVDDEDLMERIADEEEKAEMESDSDSDPEYDEDSDYY